MIDFGNGLVFPSSWFYRPDDPLEDWDEGEDEVVEDGLVEAA